jgi:putative hemolysin
VSGSFPVHDLVDLDVELPEGDYTTIAGLVLDQMNRFPRPGETIDIDDWRIEIRAVARHRITQVALRPIEPVDDQRTVAISQ